MYLMGALKTRGPVTGLASDAPDRAFAMRRCNGGQCMYLMGALETRAPARTPLTAKPCPQHGINRAHTMHFAPCWPAGFVFWVPAIDIKVGPDGFVVFGVNKF
jgi:hypothetical protein